MKYSKKTILDSLSYWKHQKALLENEECCGKDDCDCDCDCDEADNSFDSFGPRIDLSDKIGSVTNVLKKEFSKPTNRFDGNKTKEQLIQAFKDLMDENGIDTPDVRKYLILFSRESGPKVLEHIYNIYLKGSNLGTYGNRRVAEDEELNEYDDMNDYSRRLREFADTVGDLNDEWEEIRQTFEDPSKIDSSLRGLRVAIEDFDFDSLCEKEKLMKEYRRSSYNGGYGGSGKSFSALSHGERSSLRGNEIGWYAVSELDPINGKSVSPAWRCGPSNFKVVDYLYPERKYVNGAMVMRNKAATIGGTTAQVYIYVPSYFDAIKNQDTEAIAKIQAVGLPLTLTFGMNPADDYSAQYKIR